jgi:hypothetical protein
MSSITTWSFESTTTVATDSVVQHAAVLHDVLVEAGYDVEGPLDVTPHGIVVPLGTHPPKQVESSQKALAVRIARDRFEPDMQEALGWCGQPNDPLVLIGHVFASADNAIYVEASPPASMSHVNDRQREIADALRLPERYWRGSRVLLPQANEERERPSGCAPQAVPGSLVGVQSGPAIRAWTDVAGDAVNRPHVEELRLAHLAIGPNAMGPHERRRFVEIPQRGIQPTRFIIHQAHDFVVHSLRIGHVEQLYGEVPGTLFGEFVVGTTVNFPQVPAGTNISIEIENRSDERRSFSAVLIGREAPIPPAIKRKLMQLHAQHDDELRQVFADAGLGQWVREGRALRAAIDSVISSASA